MLTQLAGCASLFSEDGVFTDDVVWHLMNRNEVARTYDGGEAVVQFLLSFKDLRLESIMELDEIVVAAHSFSAGRAIAATAYHLRDELVAKTPQHFRHHAARAREPPSRRGGGSL